MKFFQIVTENSSLVNMPEREREFIFRLNNFLILFVTQPLCSHVTSLPHGEQCDFIVTNPDCNVWIHHLNYLKYIYCDFADKSAQALAIAVVCIFCILLFTILATTADKL